MQHGFTLIETLVAVTISVILLSLAIPSWQHFFQTHHQANYLNTLSKLLQYARHQAMHLGEPVSICPIGLNSSQCGYNWARGQRVYQRDHTLLLQAQSTHLPLHFRAFPSNQTITYSPLGTITRGNGTFSLCYHKQRQKMVLSRMGRIRKIREQTLCR